MPISCRLAGIAIAIGTMVDMGIIVSENIYQHLADWEKDGSPGGTERRSTLIADAATEVAPAVVTAVSTTIVSFLPVFFLTGRDYKLFSSAGLDEDFCDCVGPCGSDHTRAGPLSLYAPQCGLAP